MPDRVAAGVSLPRSLILSALMLLVAMASPDTDAPQASAVAGAVREPTAAYQSARPASLKETLQAAVILVDAGLMVAPGPSIDWPAVQHLHEVWLRRQYAAAAAAERPTPLAVRARASTAARTSAPSAAGGATLDVAYTRAVWDAVNVLRAQVGLAPVTVEARLDRAAVEYASLMAAANWFSHTGPDGSSFVDRLAMAGFPFDTQVGEVLALAPEGYDPRALARAWLNSPTHRAQILGPYSRAGLGCAWGIDGAGTRVVRCAMEFAS